MAKIVSVLFLSTILLVSIGNASGQTTERIVTILELEPLPSRAVIGESMYFSGHVKTKDGQGLAGVTLEIWATHSRGAFVLLETMTDDEGYFEVEWIIQDVAPFYYIEAIFQGNEQYESSSSEIQKVEFGLPGTVGTEIQLYDIPSAVVVGEKVVFSGYLKTDEGDAISTAEIAIEGFDLENDFELARTITDSNGFFKTEWTALIGDYEVLAHFEGKSGFESTYSNSYELIVHNGSGGLITVSLDKQEYYFNDEIAVNGTLKQPSESLVSVKIYDPSEKLYDSNFIAVNTDGTFADRLPLFDGLTGTYNIMFYHDGALEVAKFLLLNKAEIGSSGAFGPFCQSEYIQDDGGTIVGDIPMVGRTFALKHENEQFNIEVYNCGKEAESLAFNQDDRYIIVRGVDTKQVEINLPARLIGGDLAIFGDDGSEMEFELSTVEENNIIRIYEPTSSTIMIQGTTAIPEFPLVTIILALAMLTAILSVQRFLSK